MNSINQLGSTAQQSQVSDQNTVNYSSESTQSQAYSALDTPTSTTTRVSSLSIQLSDAATRAAERDATTSRKGLAAFAQSTSEKLFGESYTRNKAAHDAEVPASDDPQRLAQAQQATDFSNGEATNPFKGMSRDQLALIAYDDSGSFTVNERRAALREADDQEYQWRVKVVAKMMDEYHRTGKISAESYQEVSDHSNSLPAIEKAQLPEGYEVQQTLTQLENGTDSTQFKDELQSLVDQMTLSVDRSRQK
ncbi:hypothetical protein ACLED8_10030 [Lonsdalea quercina]|uniref:Uncharacterized protein n=1 Tax=Lonsdalea quercina TaxID=71657 RepID=A0A1H4B697_9GAMM|nr:hypothetical protein [Lonsdalea quercina]SEA43606.1 hypothetical protein SAMN02982996_01664 [Lonsdalea quercina]